MRVRCYTAVFGPGYRVLPPLVPGEHICLSDGYEAPEGWTTINVGRIEKTPLECAKRVKFYPLEFLPQDTDISIYVDHRLLPKVEFPWIAHLVDEKPLAVFGHPLRKSVYEEARYCLQHGFYERATLRAQIRDYRSRGVSKYWGLIAGGVLVRRHPELWSACWALETKRFSSNDQISFPAAVPREAYAVIPGSIYNPNPYFQMFDALRVPKEYPRP